MKLEKTMEAKHRYKSLSKNDFVSHFSVVVITKGNLLVLPFHGVELLLQYRRHLLEKDSCHHRRQPFDEDFHHNEV